MTMKARRYGAGLAAAGLAVLLAACGTSGPSRTGRSGPGNLTVWAITGGYNDVFQNSVGSYNSQNHTSSQLQLFESEAYKQKIRVSIGAGNPPDVFENWGGGSLKELIDRKLVYNLSTDATLKSRFLPSLLDSATFGGKLYGVPMNGISPAVFFYNKQVFARYHLSPPATWDGLLAIVSKLSSAGVTPLTLGGQEQWPELMYEEYLIDRIGGTGVVNKILAGDQGAWSDPSVIRANTLIRQLVGDGAFEKGFSSVSYSTGQATALLYTGKAAMELMGAWEFATIQKADPAFISDGDLGWFAFPTVSGGAGDPSDLQGNPANYFSIAANSKSISGSLKYLDDDVMSASYISNLIKDGRTPPVPGIGARLAAGPDGAWNSFVYNLAANAAHYTLSWDQALSSDEANSLLTNLSGFFLGQTSPQGLSAAMDKG